MDTLAIPDWLERLGVDKYDIIGVTIVPLIVFVVLALVGYIFAKRIKND